MIFRQFLARSLERRRRKSGELLSAASGDVSRTSAAPKFISVVSCWRRCRASAAAAAAAEKGK